MEKQKLIELLRKAYLSGIMENELAGRMVGVNHNLEDMATHYAEIEVNNGVLDDVSQQRELLNALADNFNESTHTYVGQSMIEETLKAFNCG